MGFQRIALIGADLGAESSDNKRSSGAIGESPRDFDIKVKGNLTEYAITNGPLLDGRRILEDIALLYKKNTSIQLKNLSSGIYIKGFEPQTPESYIQESSDKHSQNTDKLWEWWDTRKNYSKRLFQARLTALRPRQVIYFMVNNIKKIIQSSNDWFEINCEIENIFNLSNTPLSKQFAARAMRGQVMRYCLAVYRELLVLEKTRDENIVNSFKESASSILMERLDSLQEELFELIDELESNEQ